MDLLVLVGATSWLHTHEDACLPQFWVRWPRLQILECVEAGVDLVDSAYPHLATEGGYALCFRLRPPGAGEAAMAVGDIIGGSSAPTGPARWVGRGLLFSYSCWFRLLALQRQALAGSPRGWMPAAYRFSGCGSGPQPAAEARGRGGPMAAGDSDGLKLNMRAACYRKDLRPLVAGCTCFTCRRHTRCGGEAAEPQEAFGTAARTCFRH